MSQTDFGYQSVDASEKAARVAGVFSSVAARYDLMNDLMSGGLHRAWKAFTVALAGVREGERVLDVAAGSGDLALEFAKRAGAVGEVWVTDVNRAMLERGVFLAPSAFEAGFVSTVHGDAEVELTLSAAREAAAVAAKG